jgi:dipeptidyl aminopeptidase/acylaminoacyl peptidase
MHGSIKAQTLHDIDLDAVDPGKSGATVLIAALGPSIRRRLHHRRLVGTRRVFDHLRQAAVSLTLGVFACGAAPAHDTSIRGHDVDASGSSFEPKDFFSLVLPQDPQISPDGRQIVYVRQYADIMKDSFFSDLWVVNADGSGNRPLTHGNFHEYQPRWSPDGKQIAFLSDRSGSVQIYVQPMDGVPVAITQSAGTPSSIHWSPDSRHIAFTQVLPEAPLVVGILPTPPDGAKWAPPPVYFDKMNFRLDNMGNLPRGHAQVFVVSSAGGPSKQVTTGDFDYDGPWAHSFWGWETIAWAADGRHLMLSVDLKPDPDTRVRDSELYEISIDGGPMRALTDRRGPDRSQIASPDGRLIAYLGYDASGSESDAQNIYVMNSDGTNKRQIARELDRGAMQIAWSPDSSGIYTMYDDRGNTKLALLSLDGRRQMLAGDIGEFGLLAFNIGSFSVAKNGSFAIPVTRPQLPGDIAVGKPGTPVKLVTHLNAEWLGSHRLASVEEFSYASPFDGQHIQGWIMKPPGFSAEHKYPLILELHGGPHMNYGDRFDSEKQMMAAAGYVVVYVNPRGSTSYGRAFDELINHDFPNEADVHELTDAVDAVIARGYIDTNNVFVTGGSSGGLLTTWLIGNTHRFNAAVSFYPVIDWKSWTLGTDMTVDAINRWHTPLPWDGQGRQLLTSIDVAKNVTTPTLIMTGDSDLRTPFFQSEEFFKALKLRGTESILVQVPGEAHGIWDRPSHGISKITTLLGWFARHRTVTSSSSSDR